MTRIEPPSMSCWTRIERRASLAALCCATVSCAMMIDGHNVHAKNPNGSSSIVQATNTLVSNDTPNGATTTASSTTASAHSHQFASGKNKSAEKRNPKPTRIGITQKPKRLPRVAEATPQPNAATPIASAPIANAPIANAPIISTSNISTSNISSAKNGVLQTGASDDQLPDLGEAPANRAAHLLDPRPKRLATANLKAPVVSTFDSHDSLAPIDGPFPPMDSDASFSPRQHPFGSMASYDGMGMDRPSRRFYADESHDRQRQTRQSEALPPLPEVSKEEAKIAAARERYSAEFRRLESAGSTPTTRSRTWLPSTTSTSSQQDARRFLQQATAEYSRRAWASAEASAWEALRCAASGIDIANREASFGNNRSESSALDNLQLARTAIRESRDFAGKYGPLDSSAIQRIVISHTTGVLKNRSLHNVSAIDATDRYLNEARVRLAQLSKYSVEAAQTLDLMAAIHLGRNDPKRMPSQTALCLRRAALQGQPGNGSLAGQLGMHLAAVGLDNEAQWALEHAYSIEPAPEVAQTLNVVTNRAGDRAEAIRMIAQMQSRLPAGYEPNRGPVPTVVQLSPQEFAAISRPQMPTEAVDTTPTQARSVPAKTVSARVNSSRSSMPMTPASTGPRTGAARPNSTGQPTLGPSSNVPTNNVPTNNRPTIPVVNNAAPNNAAPNNAIPTNPDSINVGQMPTAIFGGSSTNGHPVTALPDDPAYREAKKGKSTMRKMMDSVSRLW